MKRSSISYADGKAEATAPLGLSYDDHLTLCKDIIDTSSPIEALSSPTDLRSDFGGIALKASDIHRWRNLDHTALKFSQHSYTKHNGDPAQYGELTFSGGSQPTKLALNNLGMWEQWYAGIKEYHACIEHEDIIAMLDAKLAKKGAMRFLLDKTSSSNQEIVQDLSDVFGAIAPRQTIIKRYDTGELYTPRDTSEFNDSYTTSNLASLAIRRTISRKKVHMQYSLVTSASYDIGDITAKKTYRYDLTKESNDFLSSQTDGRLTISTADDVPAEKLRYLAAKDQERNFPYDILTQALGKIREQHDPAQQLVI